LKPALLFLLLVISGLELGSSVLRCCSFLQALRWNV
jgi:hypothetical protein